MRRRRLEWVLILGAALSHTAWPDRLILFDGTTPKGMVSHVDADGIELERCGARSTYLRARVRSIELSPMGTACESREASTAAAAILASGSRLVIKPSRPIDFAREPIGQVFSGSMQESIRSFGKMLRSSSPFGNHGLCPTRRVASESPTASSG